MSGDKDGKKPASNDAEARAEQETPQAKDVSLEAVKPPLTGMIGMHIDQPDEDVTTGSPNADLDRDLAED
ncbi:hypothetical protein [Bradyrhizobium roseum]|uniref:hypothetical protein n=1 Tax=Bradyrhizobium roseum TaxID=3056648 RepID=UPI00260EAC1D|nr:hypothetical protein [Bradyrhizobium roseus]WKA26073.1 hypothetical protein QUH67_20885 [Bradyrhizobium roseus]